MALLAGAFVGTFAVGSASSVQALPLPASAGAFAGDKSVDQVAYRNGSDAADARGTRHSGRHHPAAPTDAAAPSPSECDPHPNPDKINWCGYH